VNTSRLLPIINLVGCLLITGIVVAQWLKERGLDSRIESLTKQVSETRGQYEAEHKRATALEHDIAQLKDAIESTVQAKKDAEETMAKALVERDAQAAALTAAAQEQTQTWQKAIAERDERIRSLNADLTATRKRLDEAIANLKAAGAR
jgi:chromosome segregation ATPase